jgi:hypothetical protein
MLADYNQQVQRLTALPFEATFDSLSFNRKPLYAAGTEIGELMRDAIDAIASGTQTAAGALESINNGIASGVVPAEVADSIGEIGTDLTNFADKELPAYEKALAKYKYDSAQSLANAGITEPTQQDARLKFFKDLGVPQMALLPDPSEKYKVDPTMFMDQKVLDKIGRIKNEASKTIAAEESRLYGDLKREEGWAQRTRRLGNVLAGAQQARDKALGGAPAEVKDTRSWWQKGFNKIAQGPYGPQAPFAAPAKTGTNEVGQRAFEEYLASNLPKVAQGRTVYDLSPRAKEARNKTLAAEGAMRILAKGAQPEVLKAETLLANAGLTPYQQAVNQILANAAAMQTKLKK